MNRFRIPGLLGLNPRSYQPESDAQFIDRLMSKLSDGKANLSGSAVQPLSEGQVLGLLNQIDGPSRVVAEVRELVAAPIARSEGEFRDPARSPATTSPFDQKLLDAALNQGVRVRFYKKGVPSDKPSVELKLPSLVAAAAGAAVAAVPVVPPPAQLPGPVPSGPLNLPGPFSSNAFAPGSFVPPGGGVAPGAGGSPPIAEPPPIVEAPGVSSRPDRLFSSLAR
jgi:hypothetical protein